MPNYNVWGGRASIYGNERSFGAVLEVPLRWEDGYIGVLYVDDELGRTFSDTDIHLLRLFADQAAICLANSNLLQGDAKKLQRLEQLARATREMMGDLGATSLRERLNMIAHHAAEILDAETSGVFLLRNGMLALEASFGQLSEFDPGRVPPLKIHDEPEGGLTGWIAYHGKLFKDHGPSLKLHRAVAHSKTHSPTKDCYSLLAIPLVKGAGHDEELIGLIRADNKKGGENDQALATLGFSQEDEWILTIFAEAAIVAIESAELVNRLKEQGDVLQRLISSSPAGIIAVDRQGHVTEYNKRAEQILGYTREQILHTPVASLYLDPYEPRRIGAMLHKEPDHHVRDYGTYVRSKAGESIPIQHSSTWLLDATDEWIGSVGYFVDLREQREMKRRERLLLKASKALAEAARLDDGLQRLAEMMVLELGRSFCGILLMDEGGGSLTLRAESLKGEPEWRSRGQKIFLPEWKGLAKLLEKGQPWAQEWNDPGVRSMLEKLTGTTRCETGASSSQAK